MNCHDATDTASHQLKEQDGVPHIAIFGAGSVGAYVGGRMAAAGHRVTLLDLWPEHVDKMQEEGLRLHGTQGDSIVHVRALHLHEAHQLRHEPVDVAILCVKSYDTAWMSMLLRDSLAPQGFVVSMQNGMNEEVIAQHVGYGRVAGCVLNTIGVELTGPGEVLRWMKPAAPGYAVFRLGEMHGRQTERLVKLAAMLQSVDNACVTSNLWGERWSKLANNAMASAIGPLTGMGIRAMYAHPQTRLLSIRLVQEALIVGKAMGLSMENVCAIAPETWIELDLNDRASVDEIEVGLRAWEERIGPEGQPSTLHDIRRGRRTEIDSINGLVASKAAALGVPAPLHAELTTLVKRLEAGELQQGVESISHLFR
jgi:2-dehydropantoate 2-reductase